MGVERGTDQAAVSRNGCIKEDSMTRLDYVRNEEILCKLQQRSVVCKEGERENNRIVKVMERTGSLHS